MQSFDTDNCMVCQGFPAIGTLLCETELFLKLLVALKGEKNI